MAYAEKRRYRFDRGGMIAPLTGVLGNFRDDARYLVTGKFWFISLNPVETVRVRDQIRPFAKHLVPSRASEWLDTQQDQSSVRFSHTSQIPFCVPRRRLADAVFNRLRHFSPSPRCWPRRRRPDPHRLPDSPRSPSPGGPFFAPRHSPALLPRSPTRSIGSHPSPTRSFNGTRLRAADLARRTYDDLGFSPLNQIDRTNVAALRVAGPGRFPTAPTKTRLWFTTALSSFTASAIACKH